MKNTISTQGRYRLPSTTLLHSQYFNVLYTLSKYDNTFLIHMFKLPLYVLVKILGLKYSGYIIRTNGTGIL